MHTEFPNELILSNPNDNVATAGIPVKARTHLLLPEGKKMEAGGGILFTHELALRKFPGRSVIKFDS